MSPSVGVPNQQTQSDQQQGREPGKLPYVLTQPADRILAHGSSQQRKAEIAGNARRHERHNKAVHGSAERASAQHEDLHRHDRQRHQRRYEHCAEAVPLEPVSEAMGTGFLCTLVQIGLAASPRNRVQDQIAED